MALTVGARLGAFEILSALGAGGMGEVYRATDTRLKRQVAIKVLSTAVIADPERLARLQREAEVLASLNHVNIAAIYGLEDAEGTKALVLELVEGPTLADRLGQGGLPIEECLAIARQIVEALEAAHEQGIVHRDLKPANIKVRDDGTVKVLDFGLAKAIEPAGVAAGGASVSPTITTPAMMTGVGMILGTAAYMSPEQARGKTVDKRTDVWAFGCVLYEMLAGRRAFDGEDVSETLAGVIKGDPDWAALPPGVPSPIVMLLRSTLQKDRRKRMADVAAAKFVLDHAQELVNRVEVPVTIALPVPSTPRQPLWRRAALFGGIAAAAALISGAVMWAVSRSAPPAVVRTTIATSASTALVLQGADRDVAITPDGSRIVYRGTNRLLVRALNQLEASVLSGLGAPRGVFISPDGEWIGFFDAAVLKKVAITGGPPVTIAQNISTAPRGATWGPDGTIVFSAPAGLQRVPQAGGTPIALTKVDREHGENSHLWPEFLPGGKTVLFTIVPIGGAPGSGSAQIAAADLRTGTYKVLVRGGSHAHYVSTGHLIYGVDGTLRAVAFNLGRLEVVGTPVPVLDGVVTTAQGAADFSVAANGSLLYVPGAAGAGGRNAVVSVDRQGRVSPLSGVPPDSYRDVRVSPDGTRLALATADDVWVYDLAKTTRSRLTTDPANDTRPLWTPDGSRIVFSSNRAGYPELFWRAADGTGNDERLLSRAKNLLDLRGGGWSGADGKQLLFTEVPTAGHCATAQLAIERPSDVKVLFPSEFCNDYASVSPDGHWIAYHSDVSGQSEIYTQRYPELGNRQQISLSGGMRPLWSRDGRELFFGTPDNRQMLAVPVQSGATLTAGRPQALFEVAMMSPQSGTRPYDMAPDGRFYIIRNADADAGVAPSSMILVQNWTEELKRLAPVRR
jgi:hypothetical protein